MTEHKPPQHRDRVQDRLSRSGRLILVADDCRGMIFWKPAARCGRMFCKVQVLWSEQ